MNDGTSLVIMVVILGYGRQGPENLHPIRYLILLLMQMFKLTSRSTRRGIHSEDQVVHVSEPALRANSLHM